MSPMLAYVRQISSPGGGDESAAWMDTGQGSTLSHSWYRPNEAAVLPPPQTAFPPEHNTWMGRRIIDGMYLGISKNQISL